MSGPIFLKHSEAQFISKPSPPMQPTSNGQLQYVQKPVALQRSSFVKNLQAYSPTFGWFGHSLISARLTDCAMIAPIIARNTFI